MADRHAVEFRALLSQHARERAELLRREGQNPRRVLSLEQQHLAGMEDAVGASCLSRSPESGTRCGLADLRDRHQAGHEAVTDKGKISWATMPEEHVRWLTSTRSS